MTPENLEFSGVFPIVGGVFGLRCVPFLFVLYDLYRTGETIAPWLTNRPLSPSPRTFAAP